ncbi:hypothetical protein DFS34DRAFT_682676 [Phlyctochytrium arcticum]|nr:hypothetical protein DFS34DRAFT_682676 [Phlyctochytrium arcticum]
MSRHFTGSNGAPPRQFQKICRQPPYREVIEVANAEVEGAAPVDPGVAPNIPLSAPAADHAIIAGPVDVSIPVSASPIHPPNPRCSGQVRFVPAKLRNHVMKLHAEAVEARIAELEAMREAEAQTDIIFTAEQARRIVVPQSYREATGDNCAYKEYWSNAMDAEMNSIGENGTWVRHLMVKGHKALGLKWVYDLKKNSNGDIIC